MAAIDQKKADKTLQKSYFDVLGLCCSSEASLIEKILKPLDGVKDVKVTVPTKTVVVIHDSLLISQLEIVKALNQARLEADIRAYGAKNYKKKWPSPYSVACGILLLLSFLKYIYPPLKWLAIGAVAVGIIPMIPRAIAAVRNCTLDTNILMLIAVAGSIALKDYWEAGTIVFLYTIAEWLESRAGHKATAVMSSLVNLLPQRAVLAETREEVNADEVKLKTILVVKAGEIIPIDGVVMEGNCEVDEKTLTGESFPVAKEKDSTVWAGTVNLNGYIHIKTSTLAEDCAVARMAKLVEDAQSNKSRTQRFIDKCAKYYTPVIVVVSASVAIIPAALRLQNQKQWYRTALVVLVSACPCALILSTPVAMFCALSKAAASALLFKGAEYLEILAKIKIMAFDKTGTITRGEFIVTDFRSILDDFSLKTMLYWVSSIESKSSHPMAAALVDYAKFHSVVPKPDIVEEFQNFPGEGIYGKIEGKEIYVGNRKISLRAGCATVPTLEDDAREGKSIGFVFFGSCPAGYFSLSDACRIGVNDALRELKLMGIKTAMLTGDSYTAAKHAQSQLGGALDVVHAELLPEDKARIIKEFQKEAPTAMIGDGLNDAPALATADIGISMGISGSALATESGNVILMSNDIRRIPKAVRLARRVQRKVIENVIFSMSPKVAIIALAISGHPLVWAAVLSDVGSSLLVIFNSMLLLRGTERYERKYCETSAASDIDKQNSKTVNYRLSHTDQSCCPDSETCEKRELETCSTNTCAARCQFDSSSSNCCGKNKCSESTDKHGFRSHTNRLCGTKDIGHGSCNITQDTGSCVGVDHGYLDQLTTNKESKCSNSVQRQSGCGADGEIHEVEHCDHITNSASSLDVGEHHALENSCQVNCCMNNSNPQLMDEEAGNNPPNQEDLLGHKRDGAECGEPISSTIDLYRGNNTANCSAPKACSTLKKRQVSGCCRKECCPKSSRLGFSSRGGLSQIVIQ